MTAKINNIYKYISPFWAINITGWVVLTIVTLLVYIPRQLDEPLIPIGFLLTKITGFFTTVGLRYIYKNLKYESYSILRLAIYSAVLSIISSFVWFVVDFVVSIPSQGLNNLIDYHTTNISIRILWSGFYTLYFWSTLYFVIKFWLAWKSQKEQAERAVLLAQSAQLQMLRYQVNPHFLFNSLSSLRALVRENQKKAEEMILQISKFLRYSLISKKNNQVLLSEEIEALGHYFDIERVRFGDKLITEINIDRKTGEFLIPAFLIHPIIENAIKFGMDTSSMPLKIELLASLSGSVLQIDIINSGHWVGDNKKIYRQGTGTGLKNVRQRLNLAFPNRNSFEIIKTKKRVHIKIVIEKT